MENPTLLRDAIAAIRCRSGMFLKRRSLRELDTFLTGFCFGLDMAQPEGFAHASDLRDFRKWLVAQQFNDSVDHNSVQLEWIDLVLNTENGNDEAAFDRFFFLWDEFLQTKCHLPSDK
jgi:hypothetical protein